MDESGNDASREAWNANARFWDERMGEGNDFVNVLLWEATERLLRVRPDHRILDVACGNGLTSRRLAQRGAHVTAVDFAEEMIARARARPAPGPGTVDYAIADATDRATLSALAEEPFDSVLCSMALFDMAEIDPLMSSLPGLLRPRGCFVFSLLHPCFNQPFSELSAPAGGPAAVTVTRYMTPGTRPGVAIRGQPKLQPYFHRSLTDILRPALAAGLALDALEERAFPPDHPAKRAEPEWDGRFHEIPPVMIVRLRAATGS